MRGALGVRQRRGRGAVDIDLAGVGMFEQARDVQQRRLAGARWRDQRDRSRRATPQARAVQDLQGRGTLRVAPLDRVQEDRRLLVLGVAASLIAQRLDRIEPRGAPRRIERREQARASAPSRPPPWSRRRPFGPAAATGNRFRARTARCAVSHERNWRIDSTFRQTTSPSRKPAIVPTTPIAAPVIRKMRITAPAWRPWCAGWRCRCPCPSPA